MDNYLYRISLLDQARMQADVLVPVLQALRAEVGSERANQIVFLALRTWARDLFARLGAEMPGSPIEKLQALSNATLPRIGADVDMQMLKQEPGELAFKITRCRYADLFRGLAEAELGAVLFCEPDEYILAVAGGAVTLTRRQTIMQGGSECDFCYRWKAA